MAASIDRVRVVVGIKVAALQVSSPRNRGSALSKAESPETALTIEDAALALATQWQRAGADCRNLSQRASILAALNRFEDADRDLGEAQDQLARVPDPAFAAASQVALLATDERSETSSRPCRGSGRGDAGDSNRPTAPRSSSSRAIESAIGESKYRMGTT
jgi:hypothetical protein